MDKFKKVVVGSWLGVLTASAFAQSTSGTAVDFTPLTNAIDTATITQEIMAIGGAMMTIAGVIFIVKIARRIFR